MKKRNKKGNRVKKRIITEEELSEERTLLSNERTLLSYIRTSFAIIVAGIAVLGFFKEDFSTSLGFSILAGGILFLILGIIQFFVRRKKILNSFK